MSGRFATLYWGRLFFSACVFVLLVLVGWLFAASRKRRAASVRPAEGPSPSDERLRKETVETRAFLIELEKQFERIKGARVHNAMPETDINPISFGDSVHRATLNSDPDLKAALDRAEADLRAMKTLLAELSVKRDDMRQQRDDALRDRDNWRSLAEHWKAQAQRLNLGLPAPRSAAERLTLPASRSAPPQITLEPPSPRSWWPWRRRVDRNSE